MSRAQSQSASDSHSAQNPDLASIGERAVALLSDWVACLVIVNAFGAAGWLPPETDYLYTPALLAVVYTFFFGFYTQSLGMFCLRIHCINVDTGGAIGAPRAALRALLLVLVVPILTAFFDPHSRGLHDQAARSVVIKGAKNKG